MKQRRKNTVKNEDNLRDLWDNVKRPNIRIIGVPEEEDKKKDNDKILEEITVENFPKMEKEIATQVQETQRVPNRINPRQNTPRHILIKLTKIKHKEQILKASTGPSEQVGRAQGTTKLGLRMPGVSPLLPSGSTSLSLVTPLRPGAGVWPRSSCP